jgi:hypothetical protein
LLSQVLGRGAQADAFGSAQVLDLYAQVAARGAARCASQLLERCAKAASRGAAALLQQEKGNSAEVQRTGVYETGFSIQWQGALALLSC